MQCTSLFHQQKLVNYAQVFMKQMKWIFWDWIPPAKTDSSPLPKYFTQKLGKRTKLCLDRSDHLPCNYSLCVGFYVDPYPGMYTFYIKSQQTIITYGTINLRRQQIFTIFDPSRPLPSAFQQNAYEGDFWSLCTVTFWPSADGDTPPPQDMLTS